MALNRNRPYGIVQGTTDGARYEQDGQLFDSKGEPLTPLRAAPAKSLSKRASVGDVQLDKQLEG